MVWHHIALAADYLYLPVMHSVVCDDVQRVVVTCLAHRFLVADPGHARLRLF